MLQENEITRVGGTKPIPINVRIIAATNVNLEKGIAGGTFREDLYYRINRMPIHIPPLRNRKQDIPQLCSRLIQKINQEYGRNVDKASDETISALISYDWPGNVRELDNILGRAIIFMGYHETEIEVRHLPEMILKQHRGETNTSSVPEEYGGNEASLAELVESFEASMIKKALEKHKGNKTAAAKSLGLSVRNLYYKLEKYNLANNSMQ